MSIIYISWDKYIYKRIAIRRICIVCQFVSRILNAQTFTTNQTNKQHLHVAFSYRANKNTSLERYLFARAFARGTRIGWCVTSAGDSGVLATSGLPIGAPARPCLPIGRSRRHIASRHFPRVAVGYSALATTRYRYLCLPFPTSCYPKCRGVIYRLRYDDGR